MCLSLIQIAPISTIKLVPKTYFKKSGIGLFHKCSVPKLYLQEKAYPHSFYKVRFISEAPLIVTEPGVIPSPSQTELARSFLKLISAWGLCSLIIPVPVRLPGVLYCSHSEPACPELFKFFSLSKKLLRKVNLISTSLQQDRFSTN